MLSRLTRLPIRRCLHTIPPRPRPSSSRLGFTLGATAAVAASYLTWHLNSNTHRIALDAPTKLQSVKQPSASSEFAPPTNSPSDTPFADSTPTDRGIEPPSGITSDNPDAPNVDPDGDTSADGGSGGAYDPVTGEINWDCPCLGGMAHGPCGPEFREAFSCFVFSEEEPKGINCVEKFKGMQTCFRAHPEAYGDEIMDDDEDEEPAPVAIEGVGLASTSREDTLQKPDDASSPTQAGTTKSRLDNVPSKKPSQAAAAQ